MVSPHVAYLVSVITLIFSLLMSLPLFFFSTLEPVFRDASHCQVVWPSESSDQVYTLITFLLQFLLPCITVVVVYTKIYNKFSYSSTSIINNNNNNIINRISQEKKRKRRRRTNIILFLISITFFLSWTPINIFIVVLKFINLDQVGMCECSMLHYKLFNCTLMMIFLHIST